MREGINVEVSAANRARLEAVVADRNSPQKHVWRAGIVLATADGLRMGHRLLTEHPQKGMSSSSCSAMPVGRPRSGGPEPGAGER